MELFPGRRLNLFLVLRLVLFLRRPLERCFLPLIFILPQDTHKVNGIFVAQAKLQFSLAGQTKAAAAVTEFFVNGADKANRSLKARNAVIYSRSVAMYG